MRVDYLIVGSGLTGATIARLLSDAGREVLVLERRRHVGGNVHDELHASGIRFHTYGPHYFRTSSERLWRFVNRFGAFERFVPTVMTVVDGCLQHWPVTHQYIRTLLGDEWKPAFNGTPSNFEEASLAAMPRIIYEKFVKGYTEKQWGVSPSRLSAELARRFDVRRDGKVQLTRHRWQGIPTEGYTSFTGRLLEGIPVILECDYLERRDEFGCRKRLIFTGSLDEFFGFDLGRLAYRAQLREHEFIPDRDFVQPVVQVNNPAIANGRHIRTIEWKHLPQLSGSAAIRGTLVTKETPFTPSRAAQYEYPMPTSRNRALYNRYRQCVSPHGQMLVAGRLGEYRYLDMDQAIARAMMLARTQLGVLPVV